MLGAKERKSSTYPSDHLVRHLALPRPKRAFPWEINSNALKDMTDEEANFLLKCRLNENHPAAKFCDLPEEVQQEITNLIWEVESLKSEQSLVLALIFAVPAFYSIFSFFTANAGKANGFTLMMGIVAILIIVVYTVRSHRKTKQELGVSPDDRFRAHWDLDRFLKMQLARSPR